MTKRDSGACYGVLICALNIRHKVRDYTRLYKDIIHSVWKIIVIRAVNYYHALEIRAFSAGPTSRESSELGRDVERRANVRVHHPHVTSVYDIVKRRARSAR